ncbi:hypothetical protein PHYSODRAFT_321952 [Phytophthora sojae]|uniref:Uncharacterized protein n=1 Tax=Phytophthora sojae (strain P6497) TaxID=1094619 RepID=G4YPI0_PHYSP|nr:hypothetical protein PHYSODRAFT_321952 [Phytophthora sojae]EGZ28282.1 hypothetical protein PHYSODRAFT_321952 [Phytophthora sojae]|eukprot:XP_009515557.1 hypothetical protein PHYSODRAFT_321952 [Phytophthora sojae]
MVYSSSGGLRSFVALAAMYALSTGGVLAVRAEASDVDSASGSVAAELLQECGVSDGDKSFGIQVITDPACAGGGLGCYNDHCRYCKVLDTLKSAHLESCESLGASFPTMTPLAVSQGPCNVSSGDAVVGVAGMTDPSCLYGGIGCFSDHCRFCQIETTPQSSQFVSCSWAFDSTSGSSDTGDVDFVLNNSDEYQPEASQTILSSSNSGNEEAFEAGVATLCTTTAADGDLAVGINITTDASCASGGVGCIDSICRFCKTRDTTQSAHLNACPVATKVCTTTVSAGDAAVGINIVTDTSCANGGLGCIDSVCRFCRVTTTAQSATYTDCALIGSSASATQAPAATTSAPTTAPVATASTPAPTATKQTCSQTVSDGDAAVGINIVTDSSCASGGLGCIDQSGHSSPNHYACSYYGSANHCPADNGTIDFGSGNGSSCNNSPGNDSSGSDIGTIYYHFYCVGLDIVSDIRCSDGGTGCLDDVCRFCKRFDTVQSQTYINCSSIPPSNIGADITFVPIPVVSDSDAPTRLLLSSSADSLEATSASSCTTTVSAGDAAVDNGYYSVSAFDQLPYQFNNSNSFDLNANSNAHYIFGVQDLYVNRALQDEDDGPVSAFGELLGLLANFYPYTNSNGAYYYACRDCNRFPYWCAYYRPSIDGCVDSICRFCKRFETTQSHSYMNCSDIPSTDNGADINFKAIPAVEDTLETASSEMIVAVHEATEFSPDVEEACSNVSLADGQAAGGIGVVLDTLHCPEGLAPGCIGDSGCRYCMRFPTNISDYLDYCEIVNTSSVAYALSGEGITSADEGSSFSVEERRMLLAESGGSISAEDNAQTSDRAKLFDSGTAGYAVGAVVCAGVAVVVGLVAFGMKRTVKTLKRTNKPRVDPGQVDENRPSVLVASNIGEPGIISDV